jgi:hypothetical protein
LRKKTVTERFAAAAPPAFVARRGAASAQPWRGNAHRLDGQKISTLKIHKKITDDGKTMGFFHADKKNNDLSVV